MELANADHRRIKRVDVAAYYALQGLNDRCAHDNRVHAFMRHGGMAAHALYADAEQIACGANRARSYADLAGGHAIYVVQGTDFNAGDLTESSTADQFRAATHGFVRNGVG